jgi:putative transcriptional regulator
MKTRMKEYRSRAGLTQEKLADIVGVRRETIIFLEKGKYNPSLRLAYNIARALNASIEDIFIMEDNQN